MYQCCLTGAFDVDVVSVREKHDVVSNFPADFVFDVISVYVGYVHHLFRTLRIFPLKITMENLPA